MAQVAYCSQCRENVWVTPDGRCPRGHGPEYLSDYFDAPYEPAAEHSESGPAAFDQPGYEQPVSTEPMTGLPTSPPPGSSMPPSGAVYTGQQGPRKSKTGLIIAIVIAVLLLCGVGGTIAMCSAFGSIGEAVDEAVSTIEETGVDTGLDDQLGDDSAAGLDEEIAEDIVADAERMVVYFYPDFTLVDYALASEAEQTVSYHLLAESNSAPGFYITFFADRTPGSGQEALDTATQYYDADADVFWDHPQTVASGLSNLAGPDAVAPDTLVAGIMTPFGESHPDMNVTEYAMNSNTMLTFRGISDDDLEAWYDDFTTFESVWEMGAGGEWAETSFSETPR